MAAKPEFEIAPEKVAHVIIKAREFDAKVGAWDASAEDGDADENPSAILEDLSNDPTVAEITGFIDALNDDEQASLIALAWIGRGTYEADEIGEAIETARSEVTGSTARYLLGLPLLSDYLEEGLEKLGFSAGDIESDVL